ncbi:MAG: hypothetical protein E7422_05995 [Ruminococcaceae bacterium]|jgi:hypothetical protein|nr:hypothetical protein [Oscillospiraceae bacterium]
MLHFHVITCDMEKDFFGEEHDYDKASYDYGDYVSAQVDISAQSESTSFHNNTWDSATDSYRWQVIVKEYVFTETEAEVTEYRYNVENPVGSGVTLDNYKSKTADQTLTHRFDLTRVKN